MPPKSYYNNKMRGFPDISAQSVNFPVVVNGNTQPVSGTSCASPTAGGVFGLLNDARLAAGKSSLGFLNPMLYANAGALNDVTLGIQGGCGSGTQKDGFPAKEGWDAVTGLGSPNYERLLEVVMALP
jgi:tripeptidyl-peptidase-1